MRVGAALRLRRAGRRGAFTGVDIGSRAPRQLSTRALSSLARWAAAERRVA